MHADDPRAVARRKSISTRETRIRSDRFRSIIRQFEIETKPSSEILNLLFPSVFVKKFKTHKTTSELLLINNLPIKFGIHFMCKASLHIDEISTSIIGERHSLPPSAEGFGMRLFWD